MAFSFSHWLHSFWPQELGTSCYLCLEHYFPAFCLVNTHTTFRHQLRCQPCRRFSLTHSPRTGVDASARFSHSPPCLPRLALPLYHCVFFFVCVCVWFFFWLCLTVCAILVLQPGIEPKPSAVETRLSQPRDCLKLPLLLIYFSFLLHCNFHEGKSGCFPCFVIV